MKTYENFDTEQVKIINKNNNNPVSVEEIINKIQNLSNEWWQEGMYCANHLYNNDRAEVWFTVSDYLRNFVDDLIENYKE